MKNFIDDLGINGHLTIIKLNKDGSEEVLLDDPNMIVSGMGVGLSYLFTGSGSNSILDYQIDRFQVGVSGPPAGGVTSSIFQLSGALTGTEYGSNSNLYIDTRDQITNTTISTNRIFALIPKGKITRIGNSSVRYTLVLDEDACNNISRSGSNLSLNEVGMFMRNPTGNANPRPILVCYRTFSNIRKTSDFSLIFRWTLNF
jgi:hypothetical protein